MRNTVENRYGQHLDVDVSYYFTSPYGTAIILHGIGSHKDEPQITAIADMLERVGYSTVRFSQCINDANGETLTTYLENLEDMLNWAKNQPWYEGSVVLCGHSLGASAALQYVINHPEDVNQLVLLAIMPTGPLLLRALTPVQQEEGERTGYFSRPSSSEPGVIRRQSYTLIKDAVQYDQLRDATQVQIPVFGTIGQQDISVPVAYSEALFQRFTNNRSHLHVLPNMGHTYTANDIRQIGQLFEHWLVD